MKSIITKEDAAHRQLDAAIELYFCEGDLLAIYTLCANVFVITENLAEKKKIPADKGTFYSYLKSFLTTDEFKTLKNGLGKISGFLKHADRGEIEMTDFNENQTLAFLALTANNFKSIFGYFSVPMQQICGHALRTVDEKKLKIYLPAETLEIAAKLKGRDPRFLKRAALEHIYKEKGLDIRDTTIGYLVLHP